MILLFGEKAGTNSFANRNSNNKGTKQPVENSGILASNKLQNVLSRSDYDNFMATNPTTVDYTAYENWQSGFGDFGFMAGFSDAVASLDASEGFSSFASDFSSGFSAGGFSGGSSCSSCASFSSVC